MCCWFVIPVLLMFRCDVLIVCWFVVDLLLMCVDFVDDDLLILCLICF